MISHESTLSGPLGGSIQAAIEAILEGYGAAREKHFHGQQPIIATLSRLAHLLRGSPAVLARLTLRAVPSAGKGGWAHIPWVSLLDSRETSTAQRGVYVVFLFRVDMSGVYLALNQGLLEPDKGLGRRGARAALLRRAEALRPRLSELRDHGFSLDSEVDLRGPGRSRADYASSIVAHKLYERGAVPADLALHRALSALLLAYDSYLAAPLRLDVPTRPHGRPPAAKPAQREAPPFELLPAVRELIRAIVERGFSFEPWQVAAYITALRSKPFVILAGVSGTGKSKLPALVAELTGGGATLLPVRPDWTDSSDVLGYVDLKEQFRPGALLRFARAASADPDRYHVFILDEMNLARVEQYFAEVLSRMEAREATPALGFATGPLLAFRLPRGDGWAEQGLPPNLAIVGTVNMDETTHGFSRKVLDRAFSLEISDIDLGRWEEERSLPLTPVPWPVSAFRPRALRLGGLLITEEERALVGKVIEVLSELNRLLSVAQLQVGYRVRDEIVLFVLHAREIEDAFVTHAKGRVDPLDLALEMKILPRIVGGSASVRAVVRELLGFAHLGAPFHRDEDADDLLATWKTKGRPSTFAGARYPRTAARLALMWDRLMAEGYTSYWL